jgi:hypothetical protein
MPGGFEEATIYQRAKTCVFIKKRAGFIKNSKNSLFNFGDKVHPVYTFGEEHSFSVFPSFLKQHLKLNEFKLPLARLLLVAGIVSFFATRQRASACNDHWKALETSKN